MDNIKVELIKTVFEAVSIGINPVNMILNLLVTLGIGIGIYIIYKRTYSGVAYSKSFNVSLVIISLVTAMAMMMLRSSLALSLGTLGALSIVRFRNAVKEPKDIAYMFWTIIVGLCAGTGAYILALSASILIAIVLLIFCLGKSDDLSYLLIIKGKSFDRSNIDAVIKKHTKRSKLRTKSVTVIEKECMFEISIKPNRDELLTEEIMKIDGITSSNIVAYNNETGR